MKYVLWALLIYFAWRWFSASQKKDRSSTEAPPASASDLAAGDVEKMVRCEQCGLYLPASEALVAPNALHYCSENHRVQHQSQHANSR